MQEEIIAKFTWVGTKLGIVNKEVEEQEDEEEQQEQTNEKVQENIQTDEKNFKESIFSYILYTINILCKDLVSKKN